MTPNPTGEAAICLTCDDTGWERVSSKARTVRHCGACDYWDRRRGVPPGIPEAERGATLENFEPNPHNSDAIRHAGLFVQGVHQGLYIFGPVGTGKTRLACSILNDVWKARTAVRFIRVPELMVRLTPSMGNADESDGLLASLADVAVLCLDDVGATAGTDFSRRTIQVLLDARNDRGHRTIWTSNLTPDDLGAFLADGRLPSRIVGDCRVVELGGPDQRQRRKPKRLTTSKPAQRKLKGSRW